MPPRHETEAYDTAGRLVAKLMARALATAFEALLRTRMVLPGRGVPTARDSSTNWLISASVASLILRIGSTNLLRRDNTNLLKGAAMRWSQRTNANETRLGVMQQFPSQPSSTTFTSSLYTLTLVLPIETPKDEYHRSREDQARARTSNLLVLVI
jgi:hypothetical protein